MYVIHIPRPAGCGRPGREEPGREGAEPPTTGPAEEEGTPATPCETRRGIAALMGWAPKPRAHIMSAFKKGPSQPRRKTG